MTSPTPTPTPTRQTPATRPPRAVTLTQAVAGKDVGRITIGTIHPATFGVLPQYLARISSRYPDIHIHIHNGTTDDIVRERWRLALAYDNPLCSKESITLEDLRRQRIISFSRANKSHSERYFREKFQEYGLEAQVAYTCNDTLAMLALVLAGVGFVPEWVAATPGRNFQLRSVQDVDLWIGLGLAWSAEDPTANRDSIVELGRQLVDT